MKPHSIEKIVISNTISPAEREARFRALGPIAERYGRFPKGTVLPETRVVVCPRVKVADLPEDLIPRKYFEALEHNQKIQSCCRHPENHEIEACKSHPDEKAPDIYIFYCTCGRAHRRLIGAQTDKKDEPRPSWKAS